MINEVIVRNLNTEDLVQLAQKLTAYSPEDFASMSPQELWQVLVDVSIVNANAYKGYGERTPEQKQFNETIYALKNRVLEGIVPVLNSSPYFKVNLDGDLLMVRNKDGRQVTFHIKGIDSLGGLKYSDPGQTWDTVEKAYLYDDPQEYEYAKAIFQKYNPLKWQIVKDYTERIKEAALAEFDFSTWNYLGIWDDLEWIRKIISQMEPFVSNNPALHTDISLKSLFGRYRIKMDHREAFDEIADNIAKRMGYNSAQEVNDEITAKLTKISEEIKNELSTYKQNKTMVGENKKIMKKNVVKINEDTLRRIIAESITEMLRPRKGSVGNAFSTDSPIALSQMDAVSEKYPGRFDTYDIFGRETDTQKAGDFANFIRRRSEGDDAELPLPNYGEIDLPDSREDLLRAELADDMDVYANKALGETPEGDENLWFDDADNVDNDEDDVIRMNESDLHRMVAEGVKRVLSETGLNEEGIHIKEKNKGKFNATKERTGKSTEELTHSKNPLTRKRAIFVQNAEKWNR